MNALFCTSLTVKDENDIPDNIIRSIGLHVKCTTKILSHIPIEGIILHLDPDIDVTYFISLLACSWLKKIKYLRIWQDGKYICSIYSDKITIKTGSFNYLSREIFLRKYYAKISRTDKTQMLLYTEPPLEVREFFASGLIPNKLILVTPDYLRNISIWDSLCYRNCIVTSIWLLYFIASNCLRKVRDDGIVLYKWNNRWNTLTTILHVIYNNISNSIDMRYIVEEEIKYVDDIYIQCLSIEIITLGRLCNAHP